jgi:hypothetical protein
VLGILVVTEVEEVERFCAASRWETPRKIRELFCRGLSSRGCAVTARPRIAQKTWRTFQEKSGPVRAATRNAPAMLAGLSLACLSGITLIFV